MVAGDRVSIGRLVGHMGHHAKHLGPYFRARCGMEPVLGTWSGTMLHEALWSMCGGFPSSLKVEVRKM